jgi:selenium-binding protein 1
VALGQVWVIYPQRKDANGNQGVAELLIDLGDKAKNCVAIYSDISQDGKLAYFTLTLGNHVAAVDISDLSNPKRLDNPDEDQPIIGPHCKHVPLQFPSNSSTFPPGRTVLQVRLKIAAIAGA